MTRPMERTRGFPAALWEPHDGDTFRVLVDVGFEQAARPMLRLLDVHAPELDAMALPPRGQRGGQETTDFVNGWLTAAGDSARRTRWPLWVETVLTRVPDEYNERRTFTRYLATVWRLEDCPIWGQGGARNFSLNFQVALFLSGHPEWPPGE